MCQPSSGGITGDGDVTAEADQDTAAVPDCLERCGGSEVGRERFGGCTEVDLDAGMDLDTPGRRVEADPPPAGHGVYGQRERRAVGGDGPKSTS